MQVQGFSLRRVRADVPKQIIVGPTIRRIICLGGIVGGSDAGYVYCLPVPPYR
jgi:hypothetical protein